jgi:hypothetical protein
MKYDPNGPTPDWTRYILITTREGQYLRLRYGLGEKGATLNTSLQRNADVMSAASPAAAKLRKALNLYQGRMNFGRFIGRVTARILKSLKKGEWPDYGVLRDYHFQPREPFDQMMRVSEKVTKDEGQVSVLIPIPAGGAVEAKSEAVTRYRFSLVLVAGDPVEKEVPLETALVEGPDYPYGKSAPEDCLLSIPVPVDGRPWMVCLRIESYEGKELACADRHYGLKVVAWG